MTPPRTLRLTLFMFAAFALPGALAAQGLQDTPEIAAKKAEIANAPFDRRVTLDEQLLKLIADHYGTESDEYAQQLGAYATDLNIAHRPAESLEATERSVAILVRLHGETSFTAGIARQNLALSLVLNGFKEKAVAPYRAYVAAMTEEAWRCSRVESGPGGSIVLGCRRDEKDLGDDLILYGQLLDGSVANMGHGRAASPSWGIRQHWRNAY